MDQAWVSIEFQIHLLNSTSNLFLSPTPLGLGVKKCHVLISVKQDTATRQT